MVYIATAAQTLYEEISTCHDTKKALRCQAEAEYFNIDFNGECTTTRSHAGCIIAEIQCCLCY